MGLKDRSLKISRGLSSRECAPIGVVWTTPDVVVDRAALRDGELVVADYVMTGEAIAEVPIALSRERVTLDAEDVGRVYDSAGASVGFVERGRKGGAILRFDACADPTRSAAAASMPESSTRALRTT